MTTKVNVSIEANIKEKDTLMLRQDVGTATNPETGNEYELSLANMSIPCVRSEKTGKWFTIPWPCIIDAAVAAGIDKEDEIK